MDATLSPDSLPLLSLTLDDVRALQREGAAERRKLLETTARIEAIETRLGAIKVLLDPETRSRLFGDDDTSPPLPSAAVGIPAILPRVPKITRTEWIIADLLKEGRGLDEGEIWERVKSSPIPGWPEETERTTKKLLEGMARRGKLRRRGAMLYHPHVFDSLEGISVTPRQGGKRSINTLVLEILREAGRPLPAKEITARLWQMPEVKANFNPASQYPSNVLSRMALAGELDRDGREYRLPSDNPPTKKEGLFG